MYRLLILASALALAIGWAALAQSKPDAAPAKPPEFKASQDNKAAADRNKALDELLARVLQHSPDVQVAEARLKEAEAAYRQARLMVAQKAVELQLSMDQKQGGLMQLELELKRLSQLRSAGAVSAGDVAKIESELAAQKSQLAQIEAQVNMLSGKLPATAADRTAAIEVFGVPYRVRATAMANPVGLEGMGFGGGVGHGGGDEPLRRMPRAPMANKLRNLLATPIKVPEKSDGIPLTELLNYIRSTTGAPILTKGLQDEVARIDFKGEVPLAAFFQILSDACPNVTVFVRDYGFLVTQDGPPDDAISVMDFWRTVDEVSK